MVLELQKMISDEEIKDIVSNQVGKNQWLRIILSDMLQSTDETHEREIDYLVNQIIQRANVKRMKTESYMNSLFGIQDPVKFMREIDPDYVISDELKISILSYSIRIETFPG
jgi:hypothetical protein